MYQIDAFTDRVFKGNPASVVPLDSWLDDSTMQNIALENNLSETAFFVKESDRYSIRWFTPTSEVNLCGHATLATAFVIFNYIEKESKELTFDSKSGYLKVYRDENHLTLDFPNQKPTKIETLEIFKNAFKVEPIELLKHEDYIVVFENEQTIKEISPELNELKKLDLRGVIITAKGDSVDFVSRFFAPNYGIDEDPVTGSAHSQLTPYWAERLNKTKLIAKQLSKREGDLICELSDDRVKISGKAIEFMQGEINI